MHCPGVRGPTGPERRGSGITTRVKLDGWLTAGHGGETGNSLPCGSPCRPTGRSGARVHSRHTTGAAAELGCGGAGGSRANASAGVSRSLSASCLSVGVLAQGGSRRGARCRETVRLSSRLWSRCRPQGAPTTLASSELSPGSTVKPALDSWGSSSELSTSRHGTHENTSSFLGATVNGCGVWGQHRGYARARWAWHCSHLCKGVQRAPPSGPEQGGNQAEFAAGFGAGEGSW